MSRFRLVLLATSCLLPNLVPVSGGAWAQSDFGPDQGQVGPPQAAAPVPQAARPPRAAAPAEPPAQMVPVRPVHGIDQGTGTGRAGAKGSAAPEPSGPLVQAIKVVGNQRIETGTVVSYMSVQVGDPFTADRIDNSLKTLYATGLFSDVRITRDGTTLLVHVVENPIINQIFFDGNRAVEDDTLRGVLQERTRGVFTPQLAEADRQNILDMYSKKGRFAATVEPKLIRLAQNRVNVVFEIKEGPKAQISRIVFVGNHAFGEGRLQEIINSREEAFWRILGDSDSYDPQRINFDKELLRRFYLRSGYVDFEVQDAKAELSPDRNSFFLTFVVSEGERYRYGKITVDSQLANVPNAQLQKLVDLRTGGWYDGDAVERTTTAITKDMKAKGHPFVEVHPKIERHPKEHTVDLTFNVVQGPRVFVERINIIGNTRTQDKVIRREFPFAEGDPFDPDAVRQARQSLQDLGFFSNVNVATSPGSAADRAIVNATVDEKATGELTLGGGFSTDIGLLGNIGLQEHNFLGSGVNVGINGIIAQLENQIDLSISDPYFLDRNLVTGLDLFRTVNDNQYIAEYFENQTGMTLKAGYAFSEHLSQSWTYSLIDRSIYDVLSTAGYYIKQQAVISPTILSQLGSTVVLDYRDSRVNPHTGYVIRTGVDYAGLGGNADFVRMKVDSGYYIPLDAFTGNADWGIALTGGAGYLATLGKQESILDRFYLGGDNLRGFLDGGAGPHDAQTGDSLGGRFIWTQSTELHYPLPVSPDLGLTGRAFVDVGALSQATQVPGHPITDSALPRIGAGVGVGWNTPFGLINIDVAEPILKQKYDQLQVFRFGFGTRF